jgi:hypothetical protein
MKNLVDNSEGLVYLNLNEQVNTFGGGAGDAAGLFGYAVGLVVYYGTPAGSFYEAWKRWG